MEYISNFILLMYFEHNGMCSTKIVIASQARYVNQYKKLRKEGPETLWQYLLQLSMSQAESNSKLHQNKNTKHFSCRHIHYT
jgi:hypothetical protein